MTNRIAQQRAQDRFEKASRKMRGEYPALILFTSLAATNQRIADISKLPTVESNVTLQDSDGNFYFMADYSNSDGPDIIA